MRHTKQKKNNHITYSSYRASSDNSETSNNWRRKDEEIVTPEVVPTTLVVANENIPVVVPYVDEAHIFRNYRSRHWKSSKSTSPTSSSCSSCYGKSGGSSSSKKKPRCRQSFGLILRDWQYPRYLVLHRKDSIGFEEIIRSKWEKNDINLIHYLCCDMTITERESISDMENYRASWSRLCLNEKEKNDFDSEEFKIAEQKLRDLVVNGYYYDTNYKRVIDVVLKDEKYISTTSSHTDTSLSSSEDTKDDRFVVRNTHVANVRNIPPVFVTWRKICDTCETFYKKPALEFPKGRRMKNTKESDLDCAKRECLEETNIRSDSYDILLNSYSLRERINGINGYRYNYFYYLAQLKTGENNELILDPNNIYQHIEIGEIKWCTFEEVCQLLRPCDSSRRVVFERAHSIFEEISRKKNFAVKKN